MKLDSFDLVQATKRLPVDFLEIVKSKEWEGKIFIGGGYLRAIVAREPINDIDVFVRSKSDAELLALKLAPKKDIVTTENAFTIKRKTPIQFIYRWIFDKPEDVAKSFDFTICCAVISFKDDKWESYCDDRFYVDIASKRLVYRMPARNEDAGGSMIRVLKYYEKGYRIPLRYLGDVIARLIKGIDVDRTHGLQDEERVGQIITALLVEVDPNGIHPDDI
jgi:hypothetical protein